MLQSTIRGESSFNYIEIINKFILKLIIDFIPVEFSEKEVKSLEDVYMGFKEIKTYVQNYNVVNNYHYLGV